MLQLLSTGGWRGSCSPEWRPVSQSHMFECSETFLLQSKHLWVRRSIREFIAMGLSFFNRGIGGGARRREVSEMTNLPSDLPQLELLCQVLSWTEEQNFKIIIIFRHGHNYIKACKSLTLIRAPPNRPIFVCFLFSLFFVSIMYGTLQLKQCLKMKQSTMPKWSHFEPQISSILPTMPCLYLVKYVNKWAGGGW